MQPQTEISVRWVLRYDNVHKRGNSSVAYFPLDIAIKKESFIANCTVYVIRMYMFRTGLLSEDMYPGPRHNGNILNMGTKNSY